MRLRQLPDAEQAEPDELSLDGHVLRGRAERRLLLGLLGRRADGAKRGHGSVRGGVARRGRWAQRGLLANAEAGF